MKRLGYLHEIADDIYLMLTRHKYSNGTSREYVTMNKKEITKAKECFKKLHKLAVSLKEVMK